MDAFVDFILSLVAFMGALSLYKSTKKEAKRKKNLKDVKIKTADGIKSLTPRSATDIELKALSALSDFRLKKADIYNIQGSKEERSYPNEEGYDIFICDIPIIFSTNSEKHLNIENNNVEIAIIKGVAFILSVNNTYSLVNDFNSTTP
ncbi:hypothetical protein MHO82_20430 [Vibrio sp. Of7-15]|uniref:hypothetical protein n=1 Tax=Vibrio sp. Of7-15 TaxID=2724879 RepID=UPI001EF32697|nr:hypothetical protein [Vibrio sp. Of7-15]MCG7499237.1 hypothetical protein [Vibrio sp. Of7-15]